MSQRHKDNTKRSEKRKSARDLDSLPILAENSAEGLGSRESAVASLRIFPQKNAKTLLSGARKGPVGT